MGWLSWVGLVGWFELVKVQGGEGLSGEGKNGVPVTGTGGTGGYYSRTLERARARIIGSMMSAMRTRAVIQLSSYELRLVLGASILFNALC